MIRGRDYNKSRCGGFPAFTASQWQELEQQLLTYRYIMSGIPVPPELISTVITNPSSDFFPLQQSLPCKLFHPFSQILCCYICWIPFIIQEHVYETTQSRT